MTNIESIRGIFRGREWTYLSIAPRGSEAYNAKL